MRRVGCSRGWTCSTQAHWRRRSLRPASLPTYQKRWLVMRRNVVPTRWMMDLDTSLKGPRRAEVRLLHPPAAKRTKENSMKAGIFGRHLTCVLSSSPSTWRKLSLPCNRFLRSVQDFRGMEDTRQTNNAANARVRSTKVVSGEAKFQCKDCEGMFNSYEALWYHTKSKQNMKV